MFKKQNNQSNHEKINTILSLFTHAYAHELREPIRNASNFTQLLSHQECSKFDDNAQVYIKNIQQCIDRMESVTRDISYYISLIEPVDYENVKVNTNDIVESIRKKLSATIIENKIRFNVGLLPSIFCATNHVYMLFFNLIENAVKFRSEMPLLVDIYAKQEENFWKFYISDNGIGIEREYHRSIFDIFKKLHDRNKYEGAGVGLAICKKIAQKYKGEIQVESVPSKGSTFIVTLPNDTILVGS